MSDSKKIELLRQAVCVLWEEIVSDIDSGCLWYFIDDMNCCGIDIDTARELGLPDVASDMEEYAVPAEEEE